MKALWQIISDLFTTNPLARRKYPIVSTINDIVFMATDGLWYFDGVTSKKITEDLQ